MRRSTEPPRERGDPATGARHRRGTSAADRAAAPFSEQALAGEGLSTEDRHGVFVGLGSTYRVLGRYEESLATLRRGLGEFPDDAALRTFLAMALYNVGEAHEATGTLLKVLAATSADDGVRRYRRAVEYYADHLDDAERVLLTPCQHWLTFTS
ncbi:tetratricopeptide repeat protein [Amycolatopsis japonica]|uniref:tetratricopeptide repeat protein n=1 Tax=Amycolatopsis japonica TaxID=208439 RepID=UPI003807194B